jgi:hypothetical protein
MFTLTIVPAEPEPQVTLFIVSKAPAIRGAPIIKKKFATSLARVLGLGVMASIILPLYVDFRYKFGLIQNH